MQMNLCNAYEDERDFCANRWDVDGTGVQVDRICYQKSNLVFLFLVASGENKTRDIFFQINLNYCHNNEIIPESSVHTNKKLNHKHGSDVWNILQ